MTLTRRTPLRSRSAKLAHLQRTYTALRWEFLTNNPWCLRCGGEASEVHHRAGRGALLLAVETWIALCHGCHVWVTEHPSEAYERGFSLRRIGGAS